MAHAQVSVLKREDTKPEPDVPRQPSDQVLLERFVTGGDQAAFAGIVERYGKMVWGVCRRLLWQQQDVEDALQAVFLILARKAASIRKGEAVGSWLYGVAHRTAMNARRTAARRQRRERQADHRAESGAEPWADAAARELQRLLDEEIGRLTNRYRAPFVLCCLEGMSRAEAAREFRLKEGTLSARLTRARKLLEKRLARRGVLLSAALAAGALTANTASAAAPVRLLQTAAGAGLARPPAPASAAQMSPTALALAQVVMRRMAARRLSTALAWLLALSLMLGGAALALLQLAGAGEILDPDVFVQPPRALGTAVDEQVLTVAFSPDGTRLITAGGRQDMPGQLQIWDTRAANNLVTIRGIPGVRSAAFAPGGNAVATGDFGGHVKLRDAVSGQELAAVKGHSAAAHGVAFSPDGTLLVSAGLDGTLKVWSVPGLEEKMVIRGDMDMVFSVAFFHKSPALVSGGQDKSAVIWDLDTGQRKLVLKGHQAAVEAVAVAPDDKTVATASGDRTIRLWDGETGKEKAVLHEGEARPHSLCFSPDGSLLASARSDGEVRLWDLATQKPTEEDRKHAAAAWAVAFSRDGKLLASGSSDRTAKLWRIVNGKDAVVPVKTLVTSSPLVRPIVALAYAPDGALVAMAARESPIQIRDAKTGNVLRVLTGHTGEVNCLAYSPDGGTLASGGSDGTVKLWDPQGGVERKSLRGHTGAVLALAFAPDGARIASGGADRDIRIWDRASGEQLDLFRGHEGAVRALTFKRDGQRLISGSDDRTIKIWDGKRPPEPITLSGHAGGVRALVLAGDEGLMSGSEDGTILLWDLGQRRWRARLPAHTGGVWALALTPSGRVLVSGGQDKRLCVWDAATGELRGTLHGHGAMVAALAMHPRGLHVLSGGEDKMLLRWQGARQALAPPVQAAGNPAQDKPGHIKAADVAKPPDQAVPPPQAPLRTEYPHQFYRDFRGSKQLLPPVTMFGDDADLFTHPDAQGVRVTLPAQRQGTFPVGVRCTALVEGDFEITANYEILQAERPKAGGGVGFELYLVTATAGQDALVLTRMVRPDGKEVVACSSNFTRDGKRRYLGSQVDAVSRSGRLRIVRAGTVAVFFAAEGDGGEFREIYRCPVVPDRLRMVRLGAYTGGAHEPVDVRVLDMRIRAESLADELIAAAEVDEDASGWLVAALLVALVIAILGGVSIYRYRRRQRGTGETVPTTKAALISGTFVCSGCGKKLKAKAELARRTVKCPQCHAAVEMPAVEASDAATHIVADRRRQS